MDYESILSSVDEEPSHLFRTARGSTYAHFGDNTTIRNRSGQNHKDTTVGLQPRSGKTVYMDPADVNRMAGMFQNTEIGTAFKPTSFDKESRSGKAALTFTEDYGPRKAGSVIHEAPFTVVPRKGLIPVEINRSDSPVGSSGRGIHWGNPITEILEGGLGASKARTNLPSIEPRGGGGAGAEIGMLNPLKLAGGGSIKVSDSYKQGGNWKLI